MKTLIIITIGLLAAFVFAFGFAYAFTKGLNVFATLCGLYLSWCIGCIIVLDAEEKNTRILSRYAER